MKTWILLVGAALVLANFALLYIRALFASVAAQPLSTRIREAANLSSEAPQAGDFRKMIGIYRLCPDLRHSQNRVSSVQYYYFFLRALGKAVPALSGWTTREMSTCTCYVAVRASQRAERNAAFLQQASL